MTWFILKEKLLKTQHKNEACVSPGGELESKKELGLFNEQKIE